MINCVGVAAGVDSFACISQQTNYIGGYAILVLMIAILFFRLDREAMKDRIATVLFVAALMTAMGSIKNMLFPDQFFIVSVVCFIGALVLMYIKD